MFRFRSFLFFCCSLLLLASCSRHADVDSREVLFAQLGPDFDLAVALDPEAIGRSAGEQPIERLHRTDVRFIETIWHARGIDKSLALVMSYSNPRLQAVILAITDPSDLRSSLLDSGWHSDSRDGDSEVFVCDRPDWQIVCDGSVMWIVSPRYGQSALMAVEAIKARRAHLPAWMSDRFEQCREQTLAFCAPYRNNSHLFGWASVKDASLSLNVARIDDSDGLRIGLFGTNQLRQPGAVLQALDPEADVALAMALPSSVSLDGFLDRYVFSGELVPAQIRNAAAHLDGRVALSLDIKDGAVSDVMDFDNYRVALGLGTDSAAAPGIASMLRGMVPSSMLDVRAPDSDALLVTTPGYPARSGRPSSMDAGDIVWLHIDLPAGSPLLTGFGIDCGLRAQGRVCIEEAALSVSFTDSHEGFVASLFKFITATTLD